MTITPVLFTIGLVIVAWFTLVFTHPMFRHRITVSDNSGESGQLISSVRMYDPHDSLDVVLDKAMLNIQARLDVLFPIQTQEMKVPLPEEIPMIPSHVIQAQTMLDPINKTAAATTAVLNIANVPSAMR